MSVNSIWLAGLLLLGAVALAAPGFGVLALAVVVILLLFRGAGEQIDDATHAAVDNAETPAGRVAAGIGGTLLLIVLGALAWLACVAMLLQAAP